LCRWFEKVWESFDNQQPESKIASKTGENKDACKNEITQGFFNSTVQYEHIAKHFKARQY